MSDKEKLTGKQYWRSLDELAETPEFTDFLHREFPQGASEFDNSWSRRSFLTLMGASIALAGLNGCRRPVEKVVPYVRQPEEITVGVPLYYATAMPLGLAAFGLLVKTNNGRPTKIEGNPQHPATLGATNIFGQAEILNMYDPDRSRSVRHQGTDANWDAFVTFWRERYSFFAAREGAGLVVIADAFNAPTLGRMATAFRAKFPRATWLTYDPAGQLTKVAGTAVATGQPMHPVHHTDKAKVILALDSDFLGIEMYSIAEARGFADGRRVTDRQGEMNRLYVVESGYTATGGMADHRLRVKSRQVSDFAVVLAQEFARQGVAVPFASNLATPTTQFDARWISALSRDLIRTRGEAVIIAGHRQPVHVHAVVAALNAALGAVGTTVDYVPMRDVQLTDDQQLSSVAATMNAGAVDTVIMLGANPMYNSPADVDFAAALAKVPHTVHVGLHVDETADKCEWHINEAHFLESWGDVRSLDGTPSVIQPMIEPLFNGRSKVEVASLLATGQDRRGYDIVRETWQPILGALNFEKQWRRLLHDGMWADAATRPVTPTIDMAGIGNLVSDHYRTAGAGGTDAIELNFAVSHTYDGRYANNGWLQELPYTHNKLTWDNVVEISPAMAKRLGFTSGEPTRAELGTVSFKGRNLEMPVYVQPGQADNAVTVRLGYGRTSAGRVGTGVGFNTYLLRTSDALWFGDGVTLSPSGLMYPLACVQHHWAMEGRPILREASLAEYKQGEDFKPEQPEHPPLVPMWDPFVYDKGYQWGMAVDLNTCTGCNACTIACQSENNIPVVGKEQVRRGREMHWIRIDRYFAGNPEEPDMSYQPMLCQHCENAPCEGVCPVAATVHDKEGLNTMVYNRCIGTRYCSNNCPYKVRRFNFFNYTHDLPETIQMQQNPDVTVRSRGVMEKCTYCIQRIQGAKITAKGENRTVKDGEIQTACQQACPTNAIIFGNVNDPEAQVTKLQKTDRSYAVLEELNTKPRTQYLAKLRNPNPELAGIAG